MEHLACRGFLLALTATIVIICCHVTVVVTQPETCSGTQKQLACDLLKNRNIDLAMAHQSGRVDNAYARNNLQDVCDGKKASRSSYTCPECRTTGAPGGSVCISDSVLKYLEAVAAKGSVKVNEIVGACHSCNSYHYRGLAIDLDNGPRDSELLQICRNMGGTGLNEVSHIHCSFLG